MFFLNQLIRVVKPGHVVCCHLSQLATLKSRDGYVGLKDFRGEVIRMFQKSGFWYFGEWTIAKNPQMQAIKEKVRSLAFAQLESNSRGSKPGLADFIVLFKKPGEPRNKIVPDVSRNEWIEWANGVWVGVREGNTLNVRGTKADKDEKHICPMNLTIIERCIRLYSMEEETILDPFMGIGSTGNEGLRLNRKFIGIELKREYYQSAIRNLEKVLGDKEKVGLFNFDRRK